MELSLVEDSFLNLVVREIGFSSTCVSMNTSISNSRDKDITKTLLTLNQQVKFLASYGRKSIPWAFLLWTMGIFPIVIKCNNWDVLYVFPRLSFIPWLKRRLKGKKGSFLTTPHLGLVPWKNTLNLNILNSYFIFWKSCC